MSTLTPSQRTALENTGCEVRCDDLTRMLYATDASIYRVEPRAVAFPRTAVEAADVIRAAADQHLPVIPRGAGTGLTGGAIGDGLVVDLARHNRGIEDLDPDGRTIRVGAGVVLDKLNAYLRPHGLWFGPDVATSSRATLGGMIGNNSSGAHSPVYGTTVDHVASLEIVLTNGRVAVVERGSDDLAGIRDAVDAIVERHEGLISERLPAGLVKRWAGYGLDQALRNPGDLGRIVCGSEGTLAAVVSAVVGVVPLPERRTLGVLFFDSIVEAMQAAVELRDLEPAAIEHIDRVLVDQTRGQLGFVRARELLGLDDDPAEAMLLVEFFDDPDDKLASLANRDLGRRLVMCGDPMEQEMVWSVRRAGLSLLTGCPGPAKPTTCIEDVCVRPDRLPEYVAGLEEILGGIGVEASYYGHAASGELHVRPVLDLHQQADVDRLRWISDEVSDLCRRFGASIAAEHGVGIARTEYVEDHIGRELVDASREIKHLFDPRGIMNPGKIVDDGRFKIDRDLRLGEGSTIDLPFVEQLGFVHKDGSFTGNLEQCNGCGGCRKDAPTMCPTFVATGEEIQSTRGRANTIRAALDGKFSGNILTSGELEEALSNCLSCKACRTECPSNVDLATLKAELMHARRRLSGTPIMDRVIAAADLLGRAGTRLPGFANRLLHSRGVRILMERVLGLNASRPLPSYTDQRFDTWFGSRRPTNGGGRGGVVLWDDTWVRYHEPGIGRAAVSVLEAAGFEVRLAADRRCCGRPAFSRGLLDDARRAGEHNVRLLRNGSPQEEPIVFLEPSCWSMFVDEYLQLGIEGAEEVAARCVLFEDLVDSTLERDPDALDLRPQQTLGERGGQVAIHDHCHAKALRDGSVLPRLAGRIPDVSVELLETGCCGMAGAFGMLKSKDALSREVARPLVRLIDALPAGTDVVASGTSCRHQITHLTDTEPLHIAELLARHLVNE
jgi:FAD/FMN-containing dehydrogenase/Fe-S oxidoreductase